MQKLHVKLVRELDFPNQFHAGHQDSPPLAGGRDRKKWGNSPKESMEDNAEMHFLTKREAPISINGTGA